MRRRRWRWTGEGLRPVPDDPDAPRCPEVRVGPLGIIWVCQRPEHSADDQHYFKSAPKPS